MKRPNETPDVSRLRSRAQSGRCGEAPDVRGASFLVSSVPFCGCIAPVAQIAVSSGRYLPADFPTVPPAIRPRPLLRCCMPSQSWNGCQPAMAEDGPFETMHHATDHLDERADKWPLTSLFGRKRGRPIRV